MATRLDVSSESEYATGVVKGQHATGLVRRAWDLCQHPPRQSPHRGRWQRSRRRLGEHSSRPKPNSRAQGCPSVFQRPSEGLETTSSNDTARCFRCSGRRSTGPMVRLSTPADTAGQPATSLVIATADVLTFYPQEERRRHPRPVVRLLRDRYDRLALTSWGVPEGRSRKDHFVICDFIRATPSGILKQSKRYSSFSTVCRLSPRGAMPPPL